MRNVLLVLAILLLAGCTGGEEKATPTPAAATPVATPIVTPTPIPTAAPTPTPMPMGHDCYIEGYRELADATRIQNCFMEEQDYVECVYFMLKGAREAEAEGSSLDAGWAMRLYSRSIDCAKAAEELSNAGLLPEDMSSDITNYFSCYHADAVCGTTMEQIDQILVELEEVRPEFT